MLTGHTARRLDPAVREHLGRVRAFVHPGQTSPSTPCPAEGCNEPAAPTWPVGDLRRCAEAFVVLCARHREAAQVEMLRHDATEAAALRVALRAGLLLPRPRPTPSAVVAPTVPPSEAALSPRAAGLGRRALSVLGALTRTPTTVASIVARVTAGGLTTTDARGMSHCVRSALQALRRQGLAASVGANAWVSTGAAVAARPRRAPRCSECDLPGHYARTCGTGGRR